MLVSILIAAGGALGTALPAHADDASSDPAAEASTPSVTVSATSDLRSGDVVTVRGTGFVPAADGATNGTRPPLTGKFGGVYVVFGSFLDTWRPSADAPSSSRSVLPASQKWVVDAADVATIGGSARGAVAMGPDGSFEVSIVVEEGFEGALAGGNYGIYTYPGSGAKYAPFETYTPVSFEAPAPAPAPQPTVTVSKTAGLASGEVVTVRGTGFVPAADGATNGTRPPLAGRFGGVYVAFGSFLEVWQPSSGAPRTARATADVHWLLAPAEAALVADTVPMNADGSFEVEVTVDELFEGALADGRFGIYTYPGGGVTYPAFETFTPITFGAPAPAPGEGSSDPATPVPPVTSPAPAAPTPSAPTVATPGSLSWGIKASFRDYVTSIARGAISTSGVRTAGSSFVFAQSAGGTFDRAAATGTAAYSGTVRFTGHDGVLDLVFTDPVVSVESAARGSLSVRVGGQRMTVATLNLAAAARTVSADGAITYRAVPATLTPQGVAAFNSFYPAGTALDPLSFVIGAPAPAQAAPRHVVIAQYKPSRTPAPTPPATAGISIVSGAPDLLQAGSEITIVAEGFQPGETGILVVLYSTPTVLDHNATADSSGKVTWTGVIPEGFSGEHTLTLQGSVERGLVLRLPEAIAITALATDTCAVSDAALSWGFKEAFRAYVSGTIARGEWTVADGATYETPAFGWANGAGTYDPAARKGEISFTGSVTFTGHGGVLNTTVGNPAIRFDGGDKATLLLDVSGETREGESVDSAQVEFAELDLSDVGTPEGDRIQLKDVPATLTAAGSDAFGTYEAGTELDPISLSFNVDPGCSSATDAGASPSDEKTAAPVADTGASAVDWLPWTLVALLALGLVGTGVVALRKRRAS
ncbi:HtaA domain-containing protein [Ruicaihuangia caeni]|uniref:HtaA domain-containing protein n=1 Tax=Ruicaihuangia caeni TaxID=3042517 RepID=UPI00338D6E05